MTMKEYDQWRKDNPDWDKDWQAGVAGKTYGQPKMDDGFKEVMSKVQKASWCKLESFYLNYGKSKKRN